MLFILAANPFDNPTTRWLLVCAGGLTLIYMLMRPGMRKRKDPLARMPSSLSQQRSVEREMTQLLVELSEMSRQISAQLDTRAAKLELLIKDADERLARLEGLSPEAPAHVRIAAEAAIGTQSTLPSSADIPPPRQEQRSEERYQAIYALADRGTGASDIARQLDRPRGEVELILALRAKTAS